MIPYGKQDISEQDLAAVVEVLRSDFLTQGPAVPRFESAVAGYCDAAHGVAVNSATSALHLASQALDLGPGDWLWTVPTTFVASANCGLYCGARVDFVDIDPRTYTLSVSALAEKLAATPVDRLPKVVIPVDLCGQSADMEAIAGLAARYGFRVVEDASHAIGGYYQSRPVGDGRYADITIFSFHPVKIITTGEGGMALTNSPELAQRMALLRSHGITRDPASMHEPSHGPWYYEQVELGYNYRMTDMQAALGVSQLARLDEFVGRRHALAARYDRLLADLPVTTPWQRPDAYSAWHLYVVRLAPELAARRRQVFDSLRDEGIGVNLHYIPVHLQPYYRRFGFTEGDFPEAERYYREAISLPLYPGLTEAQQDTVVEAVARACEAEWP